MAMMNASHDLKEFDMDHNSGEISQSMSSYERVRRAIEFDNPDRLPLRFEEFGKSDVMPIKTNQSAPWLYQDRPENLDEWGCLWVRTEMDNMGQVKGHPLADWNALDGYRWPDPDDPELYTGMEEKFEGSDGKYILTGLWFTLFERMHMLRGFENTLEDLYLERGKIEILADRILEYDLRVMENLHNRFPGMIHGITGSDDWGTQQGPIINPKLWREFFKPKYKQLFDLTHQFNWHFWLHTCGKVNVFMDDFVELGLDVINLEQPRTLGIEEIGRKYSGKICFAGPCDIQNTLPLNDASKIYEEADLLIQSWGCPTGGFIAVDKKEGGAYGATFETRQTMLDAFIKADRWFPATTSA